MRLFVAVSLPEEVRATLAVLANGLPGARWVDSDNLHLTLRFLGELDAGDAADVDENCNGLADDDDPSETLGMTLFYVDADAEDRKSVV
jgi:2'-5' RNA ligase